MRMVVRSAVVFVAAGLVGPFIRWIVPVTPTGPKPSSLTGDYIYNLVLLLWPAQLIAVVEINTGRFTAAMLSVGANLLVFAVVGVVTGICAPRLLLVGLVYLAVGVMVVVLAVWAFGMPFTFIDATALASALLLYSVPFLIVFRLSRTTSQ